MAGERSWAPTQRLIDLRERDPETAEAVERIVYGALAARGFLMMYAPESKTLEAIPRSVQPFAELQDPFDAAMRLKADPAQCSRAGKAKRKSTVGG
jgi:hypothetical protein